MVRLLLVMLIFTVPAFADLTYDQKVQSIAAQLKAEKEKPQPNIFNIRKLEKEYQDLLNQPSTEEVRQQNKQKAIEDFKKAQANEEKLFTDSGDISEAGQNVLSHMGAIIKTLNKEELEKLGDVFQKYQVEKWPSLMLLDKADNKVQFSAAVEQLAYELYETSKNSQKESDAKTEIASYNPYKSMKAKMSLSNFYHAAMAAGNIALKKEYVNYDVNLFKAIEDYKSYLATSNKNSSSFIESKAITFKERLATTLMFAEAIAILKVRPLGEKTDQKYDVLRQAFVASAVATLLDSHSALSHSGLGLVEVSEILLDALKPAVKANPELLDSIEEAISYLNNNPEDESLMYPRSFKAMMIQSALGATLTISLAEFFMLRGLPLLDGSLDSLIHIGMVLTVGGFTVAQILSDEGLNLVKRILEFRKLKPVFKEFKNKCLAALLKPQGIKKD